MKKLILILPLLIACREEQKQIPKPDKFQHALDSLYKVKDSLQLDMYDYEKHKADSAYNYMLKH